VLDPACGTANFLYVTMEHMKRLEAEVLELIDALGGDASMEMQGFRVRPEHFIGLEINNRPSPSPNSSSGSATSNGSTKPPAKPTPATARCSPKDRSIFEQDAVLAYDERIPRRDPDTGEILTVWDGHSTKPHPITGKEVPDESARTVLFDYINPRRAEWPKADYIVGNPPFIGPPACATPWATATPKPSAKHGKATFPSPPTSSCSGGAKPPNSCAMAKPNASASSPPTPSTKPSTAA
jgi:hypothetical protein